MRVFVPTVAASFADDVAVIAQRQAGVLSRAQLEELGVGRNLVAAQVRARRWRVVGRAAVLHRGPLTREQQWWCAVLTAGGDAMLGGLTALESAGLRGWSRDDELHLLVPKSADAVRLPGATIHETRRVPVPARGSAPPRSRVARAAVDAAVWSLSPRGAAGLLAAVVQQGLTTPALLGAELAARRRVRHGAILRPLVKDLADGAQSLAEVDLGPLLQAAGLPRPRRQEVVTTPSGRRYLDVEVDLPDGALLAIEVDGPHHLDPLTAWDDQHRQNEVVMTGRAVLRFPVQAVRHEPGAVIDQLVRMRRAHTP